MLRSLLIAAGIYAIYRHLSRYERKPYRSSSGPVADQTADLGTASDRTVRSTGTVA